MTTPVCFQSDVELSLRFSCSHALQAPGVWTILQDDERHREVVLDLKTQTGSIDDIIVADACQSRVDAWSDLQRRADSDDLVALGGVDLQQHGDRLLQHRPANVEEAPARPVHRYVGDLAVSGRHCGFRDTASFSLRVGGREEEPERGGGALTDCEVEQAALLALEGRQFASERRLEHGVDQVHALVRRQLVKLPTGRIFNRSQVGAVLHDERNPQSVPEGEGGLLLQRVIKGQSCAL